MSNYAPDQCPSCFAEPRMIVPQIDLKNGDKWICCSCGYAWPILKECAGCGKPDCDSPTCGVLGWTN